jgi:hypothetical protein
MSIWGLIMTRRTIIELCITRDQTSVLSLVMPGDLIPELLAEALYSVKSCWDEPEYAAAGIIGYLCELSKEISLAVGSRRHFYRDVLVVDFVAQLVSDRTERKSYKFRKWLERHDVP